MSRLLGKGADQLKNPSSKLYQISSMRGRKTYLKVLDREALSAIDLDFRLDGIPGLERVDLGLGLVLFGLDQLETFRLHNIHHVIIIRRIKASRIGKNHSSTGLAAVYPAIGDNWRNLAA